MPGKPSPAGTATPAEGHPARKIVKRAPSREVGSVHAPWLLNHPVDHESWLEKQFIMVALSCPVVTDIFHQPLTLQLQLDKPRDYTPDFKIKFTDGSSAIVEVKPATFVGKNAAKFKAAEDHLRRATQRFLVVTDKEIQKTGLGARAILLMRYARVRFTDDEAMECKRLLQTECDGSAQVRELVAKGVNEALIWNLVARHQLWMPAGLVDFETETISLHQPSEDCHDFFCTWIGLTSR